jgi:hypothetical protein
LVKVFTERGYRFITLKEALTDTVYQTPDKYKATSDWLSHWSFSKRKQHGAGAAGIYSEGLCGKLEARELGGAPTARE